MGATAKSSPKLYTDGVAFAERTGEINNWHELLSLGLEPDTAGGGFSSEKSDILLNYVRRNPAYHIITYVESGRYVNRFEPGKNNLYVLADGDAEPNLIYYPFLSLDWHLVFEDTVSKTLAMIKDVKNCRKTKV